METKHELEIKKIRSGRGTFNFSGKLVTQIIGGWEFQGNKYSTPEEVLKAIKVAEGHLEGSIVISNSNGAFQSQNS